MQQPKRFVGKVLKPKIICISNAISSVFMDKVKWRDLFFEVEGLEKNTKADLVHNLFLIMPLLNESIIGLCFVSISCLNRCIFLGVYLNFYYRRLKRFINMYLGLFRISIPIAIYPTINYRTSGWQGNIDNFLPVV